MTSPFDEPIITIGELFPIQDQVNALRAALHEPLREVTAQDTLAQRYLRGLLAQPGIVTDDNRDAIAKALLIMAGQVAVVASHPRAHASVTCNIVGLAGLHLLDGDVA